MRNADKIVIPDVKPKDSTETLLDTAATVLVLLADTAKRVNEIVRLAKAKGIPLDPETITSIKGLQNRKNTIANLISHFAMIIQGLEQQGLDQLVPEQGWPAEPHALSPQQPELAEELTIDHIRRAEAKKILRRERRNARRRPLSDPSLPRDHSFSRLPSMSEPQPASRVGCGLS